MGKPPDRDDARLPARPEADDVARRVAKARIAQKLFETEERVHIGRVLALARSEQVVQLVARDREQVGPEARLGAELRLGLQTREERRLLEIVGVARALRLEEPEDRVEVALEQLASGGGVAPAPAFHSSRSEV